MPAPEKYASDDGDDGGIGSDSSESSSSKDDSDSSSEEEQDTFLKESTVSESSETKRLTEQIIKKVNQDFASVGLPSFGW